MNINIATARIYVLNQQPYYLEPNYYGWTIIFTKPSTFLFNNIPSIKMGDNEEDAENFCNKIKSNFEQLDIKDAQFVVVIFDDKGSVIAIGKTCSDRWIDTKDGFAIKSFEGLRGLEGESITSIIMH